MHARISRCQEAAGSYQQRGSDYEEIDILPADQYQLMVEDFGAALHEGRPPRFLPQDAVANMAVIDMLLASAKGL